MRPTPWLTAAALVLAACGGGGDSTGPSTRSLAGGWQGSTGGVTIALTLTSTNGTVSGDGSMTSVAAAIAVVVTGTYADPAVSLTLVAQGYQPLSFTGTRAGGQITGTLNGSGFNSVPITLYKN